MTEVWLSDLGWRWQTGLGLEMNFRSDDSLDGPPHERPAGIHLGTQAALRDEADFVVGSRSVEMATDASKG